MVLTDIFKVGSVRAAWGTRVGACTLSQSHFSLHRHHWGEILLMIKICIYFTRSCFLPSCNNKFMMIIPWWDHVISHKTMEKAQQQASQIVPTSSPSLIGYTGTLCRRNVVWFYLLRSLLHNLPFRQFQRTSWWHFAFSRASPPTQTSFH